MTNVTTLWPILCLSVTGCYCDGVQSERVQNERVVEVYPTCSTASFFGGPSQCRVRLATGEHRTVIAPVAAGDCLSPSVLGGEATLVVKCGRD